MGDENSLQGQTRAHKHSAPSSDGSFLSTGITGMTGLSNGSIMYGDVSSQVTELSAGNLNDVLTMGATLPEWQTVSTGAAVSQQVIQLVNGTNTTSATLVPITGSQIVLPTRAGGYAFLSACVMFNNSGVNNNVRLAIDIGGVITTCATLRCYDAFNEHAVSVTAIAPLSGQTVQLQYSINSGSTATVINVGGALPNTSTFQSFEVS